MADPNTPSWAQGADTPAWARGASAGALVVVPPMAPVPAQPKGFVQDALDAAASNPVVQSLKANWDQAVNQGPIMNGIPSWARIGSMAISGITGKPDPLQNIAEGQLPGDMPGVRGAMETIGVGRQAGETNAQLHARYNQAMINAQQDATQREQANTVGAYDGNPLHVAERFGQQVLNAGAGITANPQYLVAPEMGVGGNVGTRVATAAAGNAGIGTVSDAAAQLMDMAQGQKKDFDIEENLKATMLGGAFGGALHGAVEVPSFVKGLFANRGMDTTPSANPIGSTIQPMTSDHIAMNAADHAQFNQLLQTGSVDDIKNFLQGKQGPQPSWASVNRFVEQRDNPNFEGAPKPVMNPKAAGGGEFNYNDQYNAHAEQQYNEQNRQAVEDHVNNQMANWKNAPQINVVHGPEDIQDPIIRQDVLSRDPEGNALGIFGSDGQVHIFSGRIHDPEVANAVLFHEGLGHFGLQQLFGDRLNTMMENLTARNVNGLSVAAKAYQKANPGTSNALAAEEVLATRSQAGTAPKSWTDALQSTVRNFGRKMGLKLDYNDAEVSHILAMTHDAVINGQPSAEANGFRGAIQNQGKFMFTGPHAQDFDPDKAFIPSDQHPRNEISDENAQLKSGYQQGLKDSAKLWKAPALQLGDILDHEELYKNYPQLKHLPVEFHDDPRYSGSYHSDPLDPIGPHIELNPNDKEPLHTILHETQHAIQDIEKYPDFMRAKMNGGTADDEMYDYNNHPSEIEAREVEGRQDMTAQNRADIPPNKFMRTDDLGRELANPEDLDDVDRLKQDPRFWTDREFRQNVIELARTRFPPDTDPETVNKFITQAQLNAARSPDYKSEDPERVYQSLQQNYSKTTIPAEELRNTALKAGISPKDIQALSTTDPGELAARVYRLGAATNLADAKLRELEERIGTPQETKLDKAAYIKALSDFNYMATRFKGETSEAGRALNFANAFPQYTNASLKEIGDALRERGQDGLANLAEDDESFNKFVKQLQTVRGQANTNPLGVQTMLSAVQKPYWEQYLTSVHMNIMLSALSTHVKAPTDMTTGITRNVIEKALAMPIGLAKRTLLSVFGVVPKPGVEVAELFNHMHGLMSAVADAEVWKAAAHAARTGESSYVTPRIDLNTGQVISQRTPTQFANQFGAISNPRLSGGPNDVLGLLNKPTDLISAQDTVFRSTEMNAQLLTLGTREARAQLGPKANTSDVMALGKNIARNPTPSMIKDAYDQTNRTLLLNDNPLNTLINRARMYRPGMTAGQRIVAFAANAVAPFIRVESNNLVNRIIQRTPLAFFDKYTREQFRMGGAAADIAMSKILYGSALLGLYWGAANYINDKLTGNGPGSVDKFKNAEAGGWRANAVHEDGQFNTGGQLGMSINPFDYHNKTAQLVASARQAWDAGEAQEGKGTALKLAFGSVMSNLASLSWVNDVDPILSTLTSKGDQAQTGVSRFVSNEAQSWIVPNGLGQIARIIDPNQRDITDPNHILGSAVKSVESGIPGLREQLPIKYSVYGTPLSNGQSYTGVHTMIPGLSGNGTTETTDPAERELDRLNAINPNGPTVVTPVLRTIKVDGQQRHLSPDEFENYQQIAGQYTVQSVRDLMSSPSWADMTDQDRIIAAKEIGKAQKLRAREELFSQ